MDLLGQKEEDFVILYHYVDDAEAYEMWKLGLGELDEVREVVVNEVHEIVVCQ